MGICLLGMMSPLLAAILMPLSSAISLAIVGLGLRVSKQGKGRVVIGPGTSYIDGAGMTMSAIDHVPGTKRLRPRPV